MNPRERIEVVLDGGIPDRIPWIPRIELWYKARSLSGTLPDRWKGASLRQVEQELSEPPLRGGRILEQSFSDIEVTTARDGERETTTYRTPVGSVRTVTRISDELRRLGLPGRVEEELLKGPADYKVWEYVVEHTVWEPRYDTFRGYDTDTGPDGLPMIAVGDVPFHEFVQKLAGYNDAFYQIADYPDEVGHLLEVMQAAQRERLWPVVIESPAQLLLFGVHLSSQFTPPEYFERHIVPYCKEFFPLLHQANKKVAMHADNDTSQIAELLEKAGWDMLECFVTAPMVPMTLERAREVWGNRMVLWGGIPSAILAPSYPIDLFKSYIENVIETVGDSTAFILGVADNVMPDSDIERVRWISDLIVSG